MDEASRRKTLFAQIVDEWERAESDIKMAEQVCDEVVFPSIKELRYAGRRLAQALRLDSSGGPADLIERYLNDALIDCHRARHDAIDAGTTHIAKVLDVATEKLGEDAVLDCYPDFPKLLKRLADIRIHIAAARGSPDQRDGIYEYLETADFKGLVDSYSTYKCSEKLIIAKAKRLRRGRVVCVAISIASLLVSILVAIFK